MTIHQTKAFKIMVLPAMAAIVIALASCGSGEIKKSDRLTAEQTELVRKYQEMKQIGLEGRAEEFMAMRDSVTRAEVEGYFERSGWSIDSARVSGWAYNWPDVAGLPVVQDTTDGEWRRIIFVKDKLFDKEGKEKALYPMIILRKNGDEWKISNASRKMSYKYDPDGNPITIDDFTYHQMFQIPPSFGSLYPQPVDTTKPPQTPKQLKLMEKAPPR